MAGPAESISSVPPLSVIPIVAVPRPLPAEVAAARNRPPEFTVQEPPTSDVLLLVFVSASEPPETRPSRTVPLNCAAITLSPEAVAC